MTIKEIYEFAKKYGLENTPLCIDYTYPDDHFYDFNIDTDMQNSYDNIEIDIALNDGKVTLLIEC